MTNHKNLTNYKNIMLNHKNNFRNLLTCNFDLRTKNLWTKNLWAKNLWSKKIVKLTTFLFVVLFSPMFFYSCGEENPSAIRIGINEIRITDGFEWYAEVYDTFDSYDKEVVDSIAILFDEIKDSRKFEIVIFANPSCDCGYTYKRFPEFIKILDSAKITEEYYQIYIAGNTSFHHPFSHKFKINGIPEFVVLKDDNFIYAISDTLKKNSNPPYNKPRTLEDALFAALKNF